MVTFLLERHGESLGNLHHIFLGHTDLDLSEGGRAQAQACARSLAGREIHALYASPLLRAYATVQAHLPYHPLPIRCDDDLREVYAGPWEGREIKVLTQLYPDMVREFFGSGFGTAQELPGMESSLAAARRMDAALRRIASAHEGETVLIGSHAGIIRAFCCLSSGVEPKEWGAFLPFAPNASVSTLIYDGNRFSLSEYGAVPWEEEQEKKPQDRAASRAPM